MRTVLILSAIVTLLPARLAAQAMPAPVFHPVSHVSNTPRNVFVGQASDTGAIGPPTHYVRHGAIIGAAVGFAAGAVGGTLIGIGCDTPLAVGATRSRCPSETIQRITAMLFFGAEGLVGGAVVGAITGKVWSIAAGK